MQYRRLLVLSALLCLLASGGAAATTYDVAVDGESARLNVTFELYADEPGVNYWRTSWRVPDGGTVLSVSDSQGEITDYTVEDGTIRFETNRGPTRTREVIDIRVRIDGIVSEEYRELDLVQLQLSGFADSRPDVPDEVTQVRVETERDLLSMSHSFGFAMALDSHAVNLSGTGPVNLHMAVSDAGVAYENFVRFGPGDLSTADDMYWVPAAVTGFLPAVNRYPVVVYPEERYDEAVDAWSAGQYRTGGIIFIQEETLASDQGPAILLHEVMHGFNEQALRWTTARRTWFDEGTASYVEWLVNANRTVPQAEIFGESVRINRSYTFPPRKTPDDLWDYYESGSDAMREWTLFGEDTVDRTFGYAYAELVIRNHVLEHGPGALTDTYRELRDLNTELDGAVTDTAESNDRILDIMDATFRPCDEPTEARLRACIDDVQEMEPVIPPLGDLDRDVAHVPLEPVEQPVVHPGAGSVLENVTGLDRETVDRLAVFLDALQRLVDRIAALFSGLL